MSRILVITLLALNLLLLGVQVLGHTPESPPPPPPQAQPPPPAGGSDGDLPRIVLASESDSAVMQRRPGLQCFTLGPFETEGTLMHVQDALEGIAIEMHTRQTEALMELGYWVSLPPFESFAEAGDAMRELQRRGMEDVAVVNNEPGVFQVSLGYFLDERNARRRRDEVRLLGFEAVTRLQRESQTRFWLDYVQSSGGPSAASVLPSGELLGLNRDIPCPAEMAGL